MRPLAPVSLGAALLAATLAGLQPAAAQTAPPADGTGATRTLAPGVQASTRFAETLRVPTKGGRTTALAVTLGDWGLSGGHTIIVPPQRFAYVAVLTTGNAEVSIGDVKRTRLSGEAWTVAPGQTMTLTLPPRGQRALLRVLTLGAPG
jgi:hypothetical protein